MLTYLRFRTEAEQIPIPKQLTALEQSRNAVAVSLRSEGQLVARTYSSGNSIAGNTIRAALRAMRSEKLPDRITANTLEDLSVEVEVLGKPRSVKQADLTESILPGLTGVELLCGMEQVRILPSESYLRGLSPEQTWRACLARLDPETASAKMERVWSIFATRHFVQPPHEAARFLYRGKLIGDRPGQYRQSLPHRMLLALLQGQGPEGRFQAGDHEAPLIDHLYLTWVLSELPDRALGNIEHETRNRCVQKALAFAAKGIQIGPEGQMRLGDLEGLDRLEAIAWMYLASGHSPVTEKSRSLREAMLDELARSGRQLVPAKPSTARRSLLPVRPLAVLSMALEAGGQSTPAEDLRKLLSQQKASNLLDLLWALRAKTEIEVPPELKPIGLAGPQRPVDETGALIAGPSKAWTQASAMAAFLLGNESADSPGIPTLGSVRSRSPLLQFCQRMAFRPPEAYFTSRPEAYLHLLRERPGSSRISLGACASYLEATLSAR